MTTTICRMVIHKSKIINHKFSSNKQQFTVLGQGPQAVVDHLLEVINIATQLLELGSHGVVVGHGLLVLAWYAVGYLAAFDHLGHTALYLMHAKGIAF